MRGKGCAPANAVCDGYVDRLTTEMFFPRDWLTTNIEELGAALEANMQWRNDARINTSLDWCSPAGYRCSLVIALQPGQICSRTLACSVFRRSQQKSPLPQGKTGFSSSLQDVKKTP